MQMEDESYTQGLGCAVVRGVGGRDGRRATGDGRRVCAVVDVVWWWVRRRSWIDLGGAQGAGEERGMGANGNDCWMECGGIAGATLL